LTPYARRVFYPVARITNEVKRIAPQIFTIKFALPPELSDFDNFNGMLDRLETSFEIQANFINMLRMN
jgi:hypothetical protein